VEIHALEPCHLAATTTAKYQPYMTFHLRGNEDIIGGRMRCEFWRYSYKWIDPHDNAMLHKEILYDRPLGAHEIQCPQFSYIEHREP
jgi:hypothetical protein